MMVIGMLGLVMMSMGGSFYAGKVGGAEKVNVLRDEISAIYGSFMVDTAALEVKVEIHEEQTGLRIAYAVKPVLADSKPRLLAHVRRLRDHVLGNAYWRKRADFVHLVLDLGAGKTLDERYVREKLSSPSTGS
jgi:hypothetical protein